MWYHQDFEIYFFHKQVNVMDSDPLLIMNLEV
jgi:hypothetical protein